jgi:hypothetical protein
MPLGASTTGITADLFKLNTPLYGIGFYNYYIIHDYRNPYAKGQIINNYLKKMS